MQLRAIFFDAGNTLVFTDREKTLVPLKSRGVEIPEEAIFAAERAARRFLDANRSSDPKLTDQRYWNIYFGEMLAGFPQWNELLPELAAASRNSANWNVVRPGTREILLELKEQYRLAVISNSDGHIADLFAGLGLADCFESITDSGIVGVQKPHPEIFRAALRTLGVAPEESVYIGDVYSIDYLGAEAVGMNAVLMDTYGTYAKSGVPAISRLGELAGFLESRQP